MKKKAAKRATMRRRKRIAEKKRAITNAACNRRGILGHIAISDATNLEELPASLFERKYMT